MISVVVIVVVSYLLGSIPFSYIAGKRLRGIDLREHGSGNLGASNTLRILGPKVAGAVLVADVAKGFLPVYLAPFYAPGHGISLHWLMIAAALFAVLGHMFSVYLKFTGGKGIATSAGAFLALAPWAFLGALIVWLGLFIPFRIVSVASMGAAIVLPVLVYLSGRLGLAEFHWPLFWLSCVISAVVLIRHQSNIRKLIEGGEHALQRNRQ